MEFAIILPRTYWQPLVFRDMKLNYILVLLEEQQDYKTNSILEDLILYTFLGIFVIFIVDSFARSGKYVR